MLKTRTDFWGAAFISTLGLSALACGAETDAKDSEAAASRGDDEASLDDDDVAADDASGSDDGTSVDDVDSNDDVGDDPPPADDDSGSADDDSGSADDDSGSADDIDVRPMPSKMNEPDPGPPPPQMGGAGGAAPSHAGAGGRPLAGGAGGASGGAASGGAPPEPASRCVNPKPVIVGTVDTGLEQCDDGVIHRPAPAVCPDNLAAREPIVSLVPPEDLPAGACQADTDCTAAPYGHCTPVDQGGIPSCVYGCVEDADCDLGQVCICGPDIGYCRASDCRTDADCEAGALCAEWYQRQGVGCGEPPQYACQTPNDACATSEDCGAEETGHSCEVVDGARACVTPPSVACGRPFLVRGAPVLAVPKLGAATAAACPGAPTAAERDALGAHWTQVGLMEHASIAAFARFCLQLLELGAPSELLVAAQTAMADETVHTRLAFDLASRYAGRDVSAGPLPMSGALENDDLETVLRLVIHEGCVGETVAALEAVEAQAHCTVPEVTRVLERIAEDERNHAALAWRFVAWAIARSEELRDVAAREFARIAAAALPVVETEPAGDLRAHGALPPSLRREVHLAALRDVVVPCAERLLAEQAHSQDLVPARVG